MSDRIRQEFYCNDCDGYFLANLNMNLNMKVLVVCPKCDRKHPRVIKNGLLYDGGSESVSYEIITTMASYRKTSHMPPPDDPKKKNFVSRGGVPLDRERWLEVSEREKGNV